MDLYFQDKLRAHIHLVNGRLVVTGPRAESVAKTLDGYRPHYGTDDKIFEMLPRLFRGYWWVDESS
jgi:hypothetical protein